MTTPAGEGSADEGGVERERPPSIVRRRLREVGSDLAEVFWRCGDDRVLGLAAEIAFFAVVSVFPALLVIAAALGSLGAVVGNDVASSVEAEVLTFLDLVLTDRAQGAVASVRELFEQGQGDVLTAASLVGLLTLSGTFSAVVSALNVVYRTKETRNWFKRRLLGLALAVGTVVVAAFVLGAVVVGPLFGEQPRLLESGVGATLLEFGRTWLRWPVLLLALVGWATALCHYAPSQRIAWRRDVAGGALAAALWLLASFGFNVYLRVAAGENPVFGALGGGLILMLWLYLLSLALVLGAELNALLLRRSRRAADPAASGTGAEG